MWLTSLFLALFLTIWASQSEGFIPPWPQPNRSPPSRVYPNFARKIYREGFATISGEIDPGGYDGTLWFDTDPSALFETASELCSFGSEQPFQFINVFVLAERGGLIFNFPPPAKNITKHTVSRKCWASR